MRVPKPRTRGIICGSVAASVVTLLFAAKILPSTMETPEAAAALSGLISALSAAFGLCRTETEKAIDAESKRRVS